MNEQKSEPIPQEAISSVPETSQVSVSTAKEHKSVLDSITKLWHKKNIESIVQNTAFPTQPQEPVGVTSPILASEVAKDTQMSVSTPEKAHIHISEKIAHIFHRKSPIKNIETSEVS
jgi:hypothetical protein